MRRIPPRVLLAFSLLSLVTSLPYLRAFLLPPPGLGFVGAFYSIPDVYNYFSYMQQAQEGAFVFEDKQSLNGAGARLVNLEWWAVGRAAGFTGWSLPVCFRILGLFASLFLIEGIDRWLGKAGLRDSHALGGLLLVFFGGGLGGGLFLAVGPPAFRFLDLVSGLFPFISTLVNPHFVTGTALLVWAILGLGGSRVGIVAGVLLGNVLGLVRPYDLVLLVLVHGGVTALTQPAREWPRRLAPLLGLLPAALVNYWTFFAGSGFQGFKSISPPVGGLVLALAPAAALAILGARPGPGESAEARYYRAGFVAWALMAFLTSAVLSLRIPYLFQSAVNMGAALLALGALGLSRWSPRVLLVAAIASSSTGLIALKLLLEDNPSWFVPRARIEVAMALRPHCRAGDVVMAPADIGMYVNAYTACRAFLTHAIAPDAPQREAELIAFYSPIPARDRLAILDRRCIRHVVLGSVSKVGEVLGGESGFVPSARTGDEPAALVVFTRPLACPS